MKPDPAPSNPNADGLVPGVATGIGNLMASMTRWEPVPVAVASERVRTALGRLGLTALVEDPSVIQESSFLPNSDAFVLSLTSLRPGSRSQRLLALRAALEVALGTGTLPLTQNLALRMVVDALALDLKDLAALFQERTGANLPPPWDPSNPAAWQGRDQSGSSPGGRWDDVGPHSPPPKAESDESGRIARIKALAMLGLEEGATQEEMKRAFHRISKVHHPDHYLPHGPEATQDATQAFRRIKEAYDLLMQVEP